MKKDAWILGRNWQTAEYFPLVSPINQEVIAEVSQCGVKEAKQAAGIASESQKEWKNRTVYQRSRVLAAFYCKLLEHREEIARISTREMGKPLKESCAEVEFAAGFVQWFAEEAKRLYGDVIPSQFADKRLMTRIEPVGPVLAITPWNFPIAMVTRKLAPALAVGCSVILKPATQGCLTALFLGELLRECQLPAGVFQVLPTNQPGLLVDELLSSPSVRKLTFTGSTEVGKTLAVKAAATIKRVSLELGGHAPLIVFQDADIPLAVEEALKAKFRNGGQACVSVNRIYVHKDIEEDFVNQFVCRTSELKVGSPFDESTDIGPLVSRGALEKVERHLIDAKAKGARVLCGGTRSDYGTNYYQPTVLTSVSRNMLIMQEETFGPLAPICTFTTADEAIAECNDTCYGLAAYLFTKDINRVYYLTEQLDYGVIGVNDGLPSTPQGPFGGMKYSGIGREGSRYGVEDYINRKFISVRLS